MDRLFFTLAGAALMFVVLMPAYLMLRDGPHNALALACKGGCTLAAAALGAAGAFLGGAGAPGGWWLAAGLVLCAAADVVLSIRFVGGMGIFLLGHLCYIAAFLRAAPLTLWSIPLFFLMASAVFLLFRRQIPAMKDRLVPFCVYAAVLLAMLALALPLPFSLGWPGGLAAAGAALFVLSDLLLARNLLAGATRFSDVFSLACYYTGQLLLASSVFLLPLF